MMLQDLYPQQSAVAFVVPHNDLQDKQKQQNEKNVQNILQNAFNCDICSNLRAQYQRSRLGFCQHYFCVECLKKQVAYKISNYQEVTCPAFQCPQIINTDSDFFKSLDSLQQLRYKKIKAYIQISKNRDSIICPNNQCIQGTLTNQNSRSLICNKCKNSYCKECFLPSHYGKCIKNQPDFYRKNHGYRQCRNCKNVIQKNQGCIHMTCTCKNQFCYVCGDVWTPQHSRQCSQPVYEDLNIFGKMRRRFSKRNIFNFFNRNFSFQKLKNLGGNGNFGIILRFLLKILIFLPIFLIYFAVCVMIGIFIVIFAIVINILIVGPKTACLQFRTLTRRKKIYFVLISPIKIGKGICERLRHLYQQLPRLTTGYFKDLFVIGLLMLGW